MDPTDEDFAEKTTGEEWVVHRVKDHDRDFDGKLWFLIEWSGNHDDTWQPRKDLDESLVAQYFTRIRKREEQAQARQRKRDYIATSKANTRTKRAARGRASAK